MSRARIILPTLLLLIALLMTLWAAVRMASAQVVRDDLWVTDGYVSSIAIQDHFLYVGGVFTQVGPPIGGWSPLDVATSNPTGPYPKVAGSVYAVAADGKGGWYLGGAFRSVLHQPRKNLAQIDAAGNLTSWNPSADSTVRALSFSNGLIYAGGDFTHMGGTARTRLAAIDTFGVLTAWNPSVSASVHSIAVFGSVYIGGEFLSAGGPSRAYIAALDASTGLATAWNPVATGVVNALAIGLTPGGILTIYAGGRFGEIGGQVRDNIAALDATNGSLTFGQATSWNPDADDEVFALRVVGSTIPTVYAGGMFTHIGGADRNGLASIASSGLANSWNPNLTTNPGIVVVRALALSGSSMYVGGGFKTAGASIRDNLAAVDLTTGVATAFNPDPNGTVFVVSTSADGNTVFAGGDLASFGGAPRANLAALDLNTGQVTTWNPTTNYFVEHLKSIGGKIYVVGGFSVVGGHSHANLARIDPSGNVDAWDPGGDDYVSAIGSRLEGAQIVIYLAGAFHHVAGQPRNYLAAVTDDASPTLLSWNPGANSLVYRMAVTPAKIYLGYSDNMIGGQTRINLAALNPSGQVLPWDPHPDGSAPNALAVGGGTLYVAADVMTQIGGQSRIQAGAVDTSLGLATPWSPNPLGYVRA